MEMFNKTSTYYCENVSRPMNMSTITKFTESNWIYKTHNQSPSNNRVKGHLHTSQSTVDSERAFYERFRFHAICNKSGKAQSGRQRAPVVSWPERSLQTSVWRKDFSTKNTIDEKIKKKNIMKKEKDKKNIYLLFDAKWYCSIKKKNKQNNKKYTFYLVT